MISCTPSLHIILSCLSELNVKILEKLFSLIRSSLLPCQHRAKLFKLLSLIAVTINERFFHTGNFLLQAFLVMENRINFLLLVQLSSFVNFWICPLLLETIFCLVKFSHKYFLHDNQHVQSYVSSSSKKMHLHQSLLLPCLIYEDGQYKK